MESNRSPSRRLELATLAIAAVAVLVLLVNGRTTSIYDDEAGGLFLVHQPLLDMLRLLGSNYSEDPPLWDILLHPWFRLVGYDLGMLRLLPTLFFAAAIPGVFLVVRRLAGARAAHFGVIALCLMPYHWLLPVAIRWYSFYACLAVWNFFFFLRMVDLACDVEPPRAASMKTRLLRALPYVLSGTCLWYTNYSAPVLFFTHLIVAVARARRRRQVLIDLVLSWAAIGMLFAPWLPTFSRQLGASTRSLTAGYTGLSLYVLVAGEFSTPWNVWIAAAATVACVLLAILLIARLDRCWVPLLVVAVTMAALLLTGTLGPKRLLILSPFLAMTVGIVLGAPLQHRRGLAALQAGFAAAAVLMVVGSAVQMGRRDGWIAYRWLDPCRQAVERVHRQSPRAVLISESKPVFFYAQAAYGPERCSLGPPRDRAVLPKAIWVPMEIQEWRSCEDALRRADRVVWVYHSPYRGPISRHFAPMTRELARYGYRVAAAEPLGRMSSRVLAQHPRFKQRSANLLDAHRLVLVYFEKGQASQPLQRAAALRRPSSGRGAAGRSSAPWPAWSACDTR